MNTPTPLTQAGDSPQRKQRGYQTDSNARRRTKYHRDPSYREKAIKGSRKTYRDHYAVEVKNCAGNEHRLAEFGTVRKVRINGEVEHRLTFDAEQVGAVLGGYHPVAVRRWIAEGKFPAPALSEFKNGVGARARVYTDAQVAAFVVAMAAHQQEKQNIYDTDTDLISRFAAAMEL